jgi:hypothetical protein
MANLREWLQQTGDEPMRKSRFTEKQMVAMLRRRQIKRSRFIEVTTRCSIQLHDNGHKAARAAAFGGRPGSRYIEGEGARATILKGLSVNLSCSWTYCKQ